MEYVGSVTSEGGGRFRYSLGERSMSREVAFCARSPGFMFSDCMYHIHLWKHRRSPFVSTDFYRTYGAPLPRLSIESELLADGERSELCSVTAQEGVNHVSGAMSIRRLLSRRRDLTFEGPLVLRFRMMEEPRDECRLCLSGWRNVSNRPRMSVCVCVCAGAEVAEEASPDHPETEEGGFRKRKREDCENESLKKLQGDFEELLTSGKNCDVTLKVQDKKFPAHRAILRARSPVFEAMFTHDMEENRSGDVAIEDSDPETFPDFLRYLYTGSTELVNQQNVCHLYAASDKYDVLLLKSKCAEFMESHVSVESFCDFYTLALTHAEEGLRVSATEFFCANAAEIAETPKWQTFLAENPNVGNDLFLKSWKRK